MDMGILGLDIMKRRRSLDELNCFLKLKGDFRINQKVKGRCIVKPVYSVDFEVEVLKLTK